ncbi:unnamed protein product [Ceratitis capitata]|uniref:(Mediterranean fruit fly) hypothetical protein n=1 Tax=Ceratitis capitata TaxID=7213 RepID=A0A811VD23_CERCA|nr:unnamed protein product [Ceratitis capitata]
MGLGLGMLRATPISKPLHRFAIVTGASLHRLIRSYHSRSAASQSFKHSPAIGDLPAGFGSFELSYGNQRTGLPCRTH